MLAGRPRAGVRDLTQENRAIADESQGTKGAPGMPKGKKHTPDQIVAILRWVAQWETAEAV